MFWSLFILRGHLTREPASIVCDNQQGDLFHFAVPHRRLRQQQLTREKLGRGLGKNEGERTGKVEINPTKKALALDKAYWLYSHLLRTIKEEPSSSGFSTERS